MNWCFSQIKLHKSCWIRLWCEVVHIANWWRCSSISVITNLAGSGIWESNFGSCPRGSKAVATHSLQCWAPPPSNIGPPHPPMLGQSNIGPPYHPMLDPPSLQCWNPPPSNTASFSTAIYLSLKNDFSHSTLIYWQF